MAKIFYRSRVIKLSLLTLGILFLAGLLYQAGIAEIIKAMARAKAVFLFFGFLTYLLLALIRALKWFLLLKRTGLQINYVGFLPFYFVNSLMGNITPFKSGEAATPFILKKYLKISSARGFSVVILDRFFELAAFVVILSLAALYIINAGVQNNFIISVFRWVFLILILLIVLFLITLVSKKIALKIFSLSKKFSIAKTALESFYESLDLFRGKKVYKFMIPLTLAGWLFEFLAFYLIMVSVLPASFLQIASAQAISMAATFLAFVPGGLGVGEAGIVYILNLFGHSIPVATTGALLARFILTGTVFLLGSLGSILIKEKGAVQ